MFFYRHKGVRDYVHEVLLPRDKVSVLCCILAIGTSLAVLVEVGTREIHCSPLLNVIFLPFLKVLSHFMGISSHKTLSIKSLSKKEVFFLFVFF